MSNTDAAIDTYVTRWCTLLDDVSEAQEALKQLKAEAKGEGFNVKALKQCVRERRLDEEAQCAQLTYEAEVALYRRAAGLPNSIETAQAAVRAAVRGGAADAD